jgi:hypothetical protein
MIGNRHIEIAVAVEVTKADVIGRLPGREGGALRFLESPFAVAKVTPMPLFLS